MDMKDTGRNLVIGALALIALVVVGLMVFNAQNGQFNFPEGSPLPTISPVNVMNVTLDEVNNSGQSGNAIVREENGQTHISIILSGELSDIPQPAHIHVGNCPDVGEIVYPLNDVVNGRSETTINATFDMLRAQEPLGINLHKSANEINIATSCGNLSF